MKELLGKLKDFLLASPTGWEDYVPLGRWLVYKKLLALLLAALLAGLGYLGWRLWPRGMPVFYYQDEEALPAYTGRARLVDEEKNRLYEGDIVQGQCSGQGKAFAPTGGLLYEGGFLEGEYSGSGTLYFPQPGQTAYEGGFLAGKYSGEGKLYGEDGALLYQGGFLAGRYEGEGTLFQKGSLLYQGGFAGGLYSGQGRLEDGDTVYDGGFLQGLYEGEGTLSLAGQVVYEGGFHAGAYEGAGKLYDMGRLCYEGTFLAGLREGQGVEYDAAGAVRYEGGFKADKYSGAGTLFDQGGVRLRLSGQFLEGVLQRQGTLYNAQGQALYQGPILAGQPDYLQLLEKPLADLEQQVLEPPEVYFCEGYIGYLYEELGFAFAARTAFPAESEAPIPPEAEDALSAQTLLVCGELFYSQVPAEGARRQQDSLPGFACFLAHQLALTRDPVRAAPVSAAPLRRGHRLWEVPGLPGYVEQAQETILSGKVLYAFEQNAFLKGQIPAVIWLRRP